MESRAKIFGHAGHTILIVFPLGLLLAAFAFDVASLMSGQDSFANVAFWNLLLGLVGGVAAMAFGVWDWLGIPRNTRAKAIGRLHGIGNTVVMLLFALSLVLRLTTPAHRVGLVGFLCELVGAALLGCTGWLGGELVDRLRIGVDDDAGPDASSSLARKRA